MKSDAIQTCIKKMHALHSITLQHCTLRQKIMQVVFKNKTKNYSEMEFFIFQKNFVQKKRSQTTGSMITTRKSASK